MGFALVGIETLSDILTLHSFVGMYLEKRWVGGWRDCDLTVGKYEPPSWKFVPGLMQKYIEDFPELKSWEAHNRFEKIHPFQDLNGRVGRLIWLSKAVDEGYDFQIPFLQMYYYQTLGALNE